MCTHVSVHLIAVMGRREQKERKRKRAAATCQSLKRVLPPKKMTVLGSDGAHLQSAGDTLPLQALSCF